MVLILIFTALFLFYGNYKEYLYEDEVLSYTAANSQYGMRPALPLNRIVRGSEFVSDAVTVRSDRRFDFGNAVGNTSSDPHPPIYLILLHFVCSLFPGTFSKWYALMINYFAGAATVVLLHMAGKYLWSREEKPERYAFSAAVIYLYSLGFMNQLMNLRMYVLLQAFTTLLTLQYLKLIERVEKGKLNEEKVFDKKDCVFLILNVLAGALTHYYFLIFAFFEAAFFTILLIKEKEIRSLILHTASYVLSGLLTVLIFPPVLWQLTGSDVGSESFDARSVSDLIMRIRVMLSQVNTELFGGNLFLYIILMAVVIIVILAVEKKTIRPSIKEAFLFITVLFYFLTVSCTTPYLTGRYLSPVYPLIILLTVSFCLTPVRVIFRSERVGLIFLMLIMAAPMFSQIKDGLYDVDKAVMQQLSKEHSDDLCIFFRGISTEENYFELQNYDRVLGMKLNPGEGEEEGDIQTIRGEKELVVYIPSDRDVDEYLKRIREIDPGFKNMDRLYRAYYSDAYLLNRGD